MLRDCSREDMLGRSHMTGGLLIQVWPITKTRNGTEHGTERNTECSVFRSNRTERNTECSVFRSNRTERNTECSVFRRMEWNVPYYTRNNKKYGMMSCKIKNKHNYI